MLCQPMQMCLVHSQAPAMHGTQPPTLPPRHKSPGQLVVDLPRAQHHPPYLLWRQQEGLPCDPVHAEVARVVAGLAVINDAVEERPDREVLEGAAALPVVQQVPVGQRDRAAGAEARKQSTIADHLGAHNMPLRLRPEGSATCCV